MSRRKKNTPSGNSQAPVMTSDAFSNPLFRLGLGSQSPLEATDYPLTRMTDNYALMNSLYRDNWVVQNVVGIIPDDMTKEWFTLSGTITPDQRAEFERAQRTTQLQQKINEGLRWGRLYGGAAGLILIRGQENMLEEPLDLETILPGSFVGIYIFDRWCGITPDMGLVNDMADPDFGLPEYYTINGEESRIVARVHHSRIIRFTGRELPFLEKIAEMYWGESEVEALYHDVVKHDNVSNNMAALTFRANIDTMEVENLNQLFSMTSTEQQRRFWNTMQAQSVMKSNFGMQLVKKGDQITNTQYTFTGLQEVYDSMCLDLSGASRIPVTKLFGRSPAGMNATGESDLRNYYDYVDTLRESKLRPILEKLLPILCMSLWGNVPEGLMINFPTLWTPTAMEIADIALKKAQAIRDTFQAGLFRADTAQRELKALAEETGMFGSITDEEIAANAGKTYQDVTAMRDPLAGLGFEGQVMDSHPTCDYSPNQPRDRYGRWTSGGAGFAGGHREESGYDLTDEEKTTLVRQDTGMSEEDASRVVSAINDYTLEGYSNIRGAQAAEESGQYLDEAEDIERYINAAPKFGDGDLYRGMSVPADFAETLHVGDVIDNGGALSSWSSNENVAFNFAVSDARGGKSVVMVIEGGTQRGTSIKHLSANGRDEDEVLIPASARYEITDIFDGNTVYIYLKEVG